MTQKRIMHSIRRADGCRVGIGFTFRAVATLMVAATAAMAQTGGGATLGRHRQGLHRIRRGASQGDSRQYRDHLHYRNHDRERMAATTFRI